MDLLTAALACSLYPDEALVRGLVHVMSGDQALFVADLSHAEAASTVDRSAAEAASQRFTARGSRVGFGLLALPADLFDDLAGGPPSPAVLWDPCRNLGLGTQLLADFDFSCRKHAGGRLRRVVRTAPVNRACVVRSYATALDLPWQRLVPAVLSQARAAGGADGRSRPDSAPIGLARSTGPSGRSPTPGRSPFDPRPLREVIRPAAIEAAPPPAHPFDPQTLLTSPDHGKEEIAQPNSRASH